MMWFFAILIVLAMGGVALVAAGRGAPLAEAYDDRPDALRARRTASWPATTCAGCGSRWRFRGYRMSEVDALLDRLADQLERGRRRAPPRIRNVRPTERVDGGGTDRLGHTSAPCRPT